jgi:uncharacterized protein (DUF3820 family)
MTSLFSMEHTIIIDCKYKGRNLYDITDCAFVLWYIRHFRLILIPKELKDLAHNIPPEFLS